MRHHRSALQILAATFMASLVLTAGSSAAGIDEPGMETSVRTPTLRSLNIAMSGGRWFDGAGFIARDWYSVDGKLTRYRPSRIDMTVDLSGRYVLPPLAEAHNHNLQNRWSARQVADDYMRRGIFYNAQMAAHGEMIAGYRDLLNAPGYPDVLWAEATFSSSNGHPIALALGSARANNIPLTKEDLVDKAFWAVDSVADIEARWPAIAESRPKLIKIILVDANDETSRADPANDGKTGIRPELAAELVRRAHAVGARVAAHVQTADDARLAVEAGVDILAHLPVSPGRYISDTDLRLDDATIARMQAQGTFVILTIEVYRQIYSRRPEIWARILPIAQDNVARLKAAGVLILTGSDLWGGSVVDEIKTLARDGFFTPEEVLRIATETTPLALFPDRPIGRFEEGAEASLIALDRDPTSDLSALDLIVFAMKQGEVISR